MSENATKVLLSIDTSTKRLLLGLRFGGDRLVQSSEDSERSHGQFIIKKIGELFQSASVQLEELEGIVVCVGPGSFTGLRIGIAAAKGIAMALDIPIVPVSAFEIAAYCLRNLKEVVKVVVPLNREECIVGTVNKGTHDPDKIKIVKYAQLFYMVKNDAVAALGFHLHERFPETPAKDHTEILNYKAADLLYLGIEKILRGEIADTATLEPLYLQKSQAEIRFEQRQQDK
ncbi:MAG: tRNA (adenosine(37)-N6)-threonylcarbamoyltransferase complex dimerization subunit type 1 TsaB [Candidatus Zixiibacteriota bacterium]|nr:MAG: tRNA (adenosine(37)-N6)-threonylcarbamoyltransferase complex dimerization subunit type 1 TsaB [candidate division Zixibacteria bacterium]